MTKLLGGLLLLLTLTSQVEAARALRVKHLPTNQWLQIIVTGPYVTEAEFRTHAARVFALPESELVVIVSEWTESQLTDARSTMAAGNHDGLGVIAEARRVVERPEEMRRALGTIFAGTAAEKKARWADVIQANPWVGTVLILLREPMTPDSKAVVGELMTRVCRRIGATPGEVLTAAEYGNLRTLAVDNGFGALVPARPCL